MLFKSTGEFNNLSRVFDYGDFVLYTFKNKGPREFFIDPEGDKERLVFSLKNSVTLNGQRMEEKDMAYVPLGSELSVSMDQDSVVFVAEDQGTKKFEFYIKKYQDAQRMRIGKQTFQRTVIVSIGEGEHANKFIAGYVEETIGEWSSYPPHKHDDKPEAYIFYGIDPGFAVQLEMDEKDERAYVVHDYDTVLIPRGYHPHVNTSLTGSNYAWVISAPPDKRNLGVEIHPAFRGVDLGKSHLTVKDGA